VMAAILVLTFFAGRGVALMLEWVIAGYRR
jgi:hypothetical protein